MPKCGSRNFFVWKNNIHFSVLSEKSYIFFTPKSLEKSGKLILPNQWGEGVPTEQPSMLSSAAWLHFNRTGQKTFTN